MIISILCARLLIKINRRIVSFTFRSFQSRVNKERRRRGNEKEGGRNSERHAVPVFISTLKVLKEKKNLGIVRAGGRTSLEKSIETFHPSCIRSAPWRQPMKSF